MKAINNPGNILNFIRLVLDSIFAAIIAGTTMAILNLLVVIITKFHIIDWNEKTVGRKYLFIYPTKNVNKAIKM